MGRRLHRLSLHRHRAFPIREGQRHGAVQGKEAAHLNGNGFGSVAARRFQLLGVAETRHLRAGGRRQTGPKPQHCLLTGRGLRAGIAQVVVLPLAQLQTVAVVQRTNQSYPCQISPDGRDRAQRQTLVAHPFRRAHGRVLRAARMAPGKSAPVEDLPQLLHRRRVFRIEAACRQIVQRTAIRFRHYSHVFRAFQPPLHLEGAYARVPQLRQDGVGAQILQRKPRRLPAVPFKAHPAGLGAPAPVAASSPRHGGHQAPAADGGTQRAVGKDFRLYARLRHPANLVQ